MLEALECNEEFWCREENPEAGLAGFVHVHLDDDIIDDMIVVVARHEVLREGRWGSGNLCAPRAEMFISMRCAVPTTAILLFLAR